MSVSNDIAVLRKFPIFHSLSREHLRLLAFSAEHLSFKKGDMLFSEGEPADCAFIILSGKIEFLHSSDEEDVIIGTVGPNEMIGETALIVPDLTHKNTARALESSRALKLSQAIFRRFLTEFPTLVPEIHAYFDKRIKQIATTLDRLSSTFPE